MPIYMGIDGGASKTACAVGDGAVLLGRATAGGSNVVRVGEPAARAALQAAIAQACAAAVVDPHQLTRTCVGIAGITVATVREAVRQIVTASVGGKVEVVGDMDVALEAAFDCGPGTIVVAGTGSFAFARDSHGRTARAGGWGHAISDEGSGVWIGKRAVGGILRARDRGRPSRMENAIFEEWSLSTYEDLVKIANCSPAPDFAGLFPAVVTAADAGDEVARRILADAGEELAEVAAIAIRALWSDAQWVRVALAGGVFRHSRLVRQAFFTALNARRPRVGVSFSIVEPVVGALALARKGLAARRLAR